MPPEDRPDTSSEGSPPAPGTCAGDVASAGSRPRRRWRRWGVIFGVVALVLAVVAEVTARWVLRLGDPPLYMADAQVEYLMVPNRTYQRFYATSTYNRWSMRHTPDIEPVKSDPREVRVLVMGDSVVNGGPQTDDAQLATSIVQKMIESEYQRPVVVANISAGSWGPGNLVGYVRKFGFFSADAVVIVLNHEDATDVPTFDPLGSAMPTRTPILALEEAVFRYIPLWVGSNLGRSSAQSPPPSPEEALRREDQAIGSLRELVAMARASGVKVAAVLHASRTELDSGPKPGTQRLRVTLRGLEVPVFDDAEAFRQAVESGQEAYRDDIHVLPGGQALLAQVILQAVREVVR